MQISSIFKCVFFSPNKCNYAIQRFFLLVFNFEIHISKIYIILLLAINVDYSVMFMSTFVLTEMFEINEF